VAVFDGKFHLPPAYLRIYYPEGTDFQNHPYWAGETSLDVEWAHALAPEAQISLVVAKSALIRDLLTAVKYATGTLGAQVVSMSWAADEFSGETHGNSYFSHPGTIFVSSSGDSSTPPWPAASKNVIGVGGTSLTRNGDTWSEVAWPESGGGVSAYEAEPGYQITYGITATGRGIPDVSFDADPDTGVAVYDSTPVQGSAGWFVVGGNSLGARPPMRLISGTSPAAATEPTAPAPVMAS
jgi:subtilase family serine protease